MARRTNWKTSSQRRGRPGSTISSGTNSINTSFLQQLNPYKPSSSQMENSTTLVSSIGYANYERNATSTRCRRSLSLSFKKCEETSMSDLFDASLGLDDDLDKFLSDIESNNNESDKKERLKPTEQISNALPTQGISENDTNRGPFPTVADSEQLDGFGLSQNDTIQKTKRPLVLPVNFGNPDPGCNRNFDAGEVPNDHGDHSGSLATGSNNEDSALSSELMPDAGVLPLLSSSLHQSEKSHSIILNDDVMDIDRQTFDFVISTVGNDNSVENSILDENDMHDDYPSQNTFVNSAAVVTNETSLSNKSPVGSKPEPTGLSFSSNSFENVDMHNNGGRERDSRIKYSEPTNNFGIAHHYLSHKDEVISTVTDQTDTPIIFTYKHSRDDDSVSQITSSIAGHSYLKNIPLSTNRLAQNRTGCIGLLRANEARRNNRKRGAVAAGTFGRDRSRNTSRGSTFGSGDIVGIYNGSEDLSHEGGRSNLDEIAFALNAESGRQSLLSGRSRRPPTELQRPRRSRATEFDDICTIDSGNTGISKRRSLDILDGKSNISTLGMGGVSCGAQSVNNMSNATRSTSSSDGLIKGLSMLARKAQHHAGRFFFPTSPKVTQRKKFDRSDSLEELLLEEGANTLSIRRYPSRPKSQDNDDIDYFSRVMSVSQGSGSRQSSHGSGQRKLSPARIGISMSVMITTLALYRSFGYNRSKGASGHHKVSNIGLPGHDWGHSLSSGVNRKERIKRDQDQLQQNHLSDPYYFDPVAEDNHHDNSGITSKNNKNQFVNTADFDSSPFQKGIDTPFYWHVPRSGGGTVNDVLGSCLKLVLASDAGGRGAFGQEESLRIVQLSRQMSFVNVDTSSIQGIKRAKRLGLVTSGLAEVVLSPLLHDATALFSPTHRGRLFTLLRHPIERAVSLFYYIQDMERESQIRNDQLAEISIEDFYNQGLAENNWLTRFLTNEPVKRELNEEDLEQAKEILGRKFLIGLLEEKELSFQRFQRYFGWRTGDESVECERETISMSWPMKNRYVSIDEGSDAWYLIVAQNLFDLQLYEYAKELFLQQESLIPA